MNNKTQEIQEMACERIGSTTIRNFIANNNKKLSVEDSIIIIYNSDISINTKYVLLDTILELIDLQATDAIDKDIYEQLIIAIKDLKYLIKTINGNHGSIFAKNTNGEIYCSNELKNINAVYGDEIIIFSNNGTREFKVYMNKNNEVSSYKMHNRDEELLCKFVDIPNDIGIGDIVIDKDEPVDKDDRTEFIVVNKSDKLNHTYNDNVIMVVPKSIFDTTDTNIKDTIEKTYSDRIKYFFDNKESDLIAKNISNIHITKIERIHRNEE